MASSLEMVLIAFHSLLKRASSCVDSSRERARIKVAFKSALGSKLRI